MYVLALSTGFHRQLSLDIYPGVNFSCFHAGPIPSAHRRSSASVLSIKSWQVAASIQHLAKVLNNDCANSTVFWSEILDSLGISLVIPLRISHEHSYQRQPCSFYILLIRLSLSPAHLLSFSLMRWRDWQQWWGHITSHLVSTVATCAPQCHMGSSLPEGRWVPSI